MQGGGARACSSATTSAKPMPTADRTPEYRCTKIVRMPRDRAIAQACCPPAPPKEARTCCETSKPRICVSARIGRHMVSLATLIKPIATCRKSYSVLIWIESQRYFSFQQACRGYPEARWHEDPEQVDTSNEDHLINALLGLSFLLALRIHFCCYLFQSFEGGIRVEGLIFTFPKNCWEKLRKNAAQHKVSICDGCIPLLPTHSKSQNRR